LGVTLIFFFHLKFSNKLRKADSVNWQYWLCTWQVCLLASDPKCMSQDVMICYSAARCTLGNEDELMGYFIFKLRVSMNLCTAVI
jgi:hypothetical protein